MKTGTQIKDFSHQLNATPTQPGVYLMKDAAEGIIYVGKAASLRNRLRSYFQTPTGKQPKIQQMISRIADFEYIVTETVSEALILENLLIKQHKPRYNARLKDDKTYPYIKIDLTEPFPQLYFTRRVIADGARYFGPYASAGSVRKTMDLLKKLFPYRSCTKVITGTDDRPCLEYYINRCIAPCTGAASKGEYEEVVRQVVQFERAAALRDQVRAIQSVSERQKIASSKDENEDVVALAVDQGEVWVEIFNIRHGRVVSRDHFIMEGTEDETESALLTTFVQQFYDSATTVPPSLLVQHPLEDEKLLSGWLSQKRGGTVSIRVPQRGEKRKLVAMVAENARQGLTQKRLKWLTESDKVFQAQAEVQEALSLPELPRRIECYDISNIQGSNTVGSMVVFEEGRPKNSQYRRFQIKSVEGVDDYSSMQEMLRRRFKHMGNVLAARAQPGADILAVEERAHHAVPDLGTRQLRHRKRRYAKAGPIAPEQPEAAAATPKQETWGLIPDLVLIDGGKGHLSAALEVFLQLGITNIPLASIAKQREELFIPHQLEPVLLPRTSQGLYLVQRVRDEAHRFAITYHRQRRSKAAVRSSLDTVQGVGPKRRRELLRHFGSVAQIREATLNEVAAVPGITKALAQRVKDTLGGRDT
jgi:excinuclease ABC subunit C